MTQSYVYSLDYNKLVSEVGVSETLSIISALSESSFEDEDLLNSLMENNFYKPMMQINSMDTGLSKEQMNLLQNHTGKDIYKSKEEGFMPTKFLYDSPAWQLKPSDIIVDNNHLNLISENDKKIYSRNSRVESILDRDFQNNEPSYFFSFNTTDIRKGFKAAKDFVKTDILLEIPKILEEADKPTRIAITGYILHKGLSFKDVSPKKGTADQLLSAIDILPEKYIDEYKEQVGLAIFKGTEKTNIKDMYHAIDKSQKLYFQFLDNAENGKEKANLLVLEQLDNILEDSQNFNQDTLLLALNSQENSSKNMISKDMKTRKKTSYSY